MFTEVAGETVQNKSTFETFADWIRTRKKPYCNGEALWWERLALSESELDKTKAIERVITRGERAFRTTAAKADLTALP